MGIKAFGHRIPSRGNVADARVAGNGPTLAEVESPDAADPLVAAAPPPEDAVLPGPPPVVPPEVGEAPAPTAPTTATLEAPPYEPELVGVVPMPLGVTPAAHGPAPMWSQAGGRGAIWAR